MDMSPTVPGHLQQDLLLSTGVFWCLAFEGHSMDLSISISKAGSGAPIQGQ